MTATPALLPCPFCASSDLRVLGDAHGEAMMGGFNVLCGNPNCQASARHSGQRDKAIAAWNRRALSAQPAAVTGWEIDDTLEQAIHNYEMAAIKHGRNGENAIAVDAAADVMRSLIVNRPATHPQAAPPKDSAP
ncbi:Lar family restriction alleviation protein [Lysobacter koreensis]|uniref:Lar family restriction alleviation protein n=1 Tax=Lysobacter koreensis TaxID=266122 RepID=A0ABW2YJ43_9GAMM